jgi:hypothetical protein
VADIKERVMISPRRAIFWSLAVLLGALVWSPAANGQQGHVWVIELPNGEDQVIRHETLTFETLDSPQYELRIDRLNLEVRGRTSPLLVEVAVGGPSCTPALQFKNVMFDGRYPPYALGKPTFSRLYTTDPVIDMGPRYPGPGHVMNLPMVFVDGRRAETPVDPDPGPISVYDGEWVRNVPDDWACELIVRARRPPACTMWAQTTGAVHHTAFGDFAYFNTFENGVPITTGTIADPGMHELLGDFVGLMEGMSEMMEDEALAGEDVAPSVEPGTPTGAGAMQQMRDEMFGEGGDTFGLTLTDLNAEAAAPDPDGWGRDLKELAQGVSVLAGSFTLEASAAGGLEFLESPNQSIDLETGAGSIMTVPLSSLRVVPGGLDGNLNRVPFVYDGTQGSAILIINEYDEDYIVGQVGGELFTETEYDGRKLSIQVAATFAASRGFRSCVR